MTSQNPPPATAPKMGNLQVDGFFQKLQKAVYLMWVQLGSGTGAGTFSAVNLGKTVTAGGTTGAQTINKACGSVNFAASASSLVVTNSLVSTSSVVMATVATNDATMTSVQAVAGSGSFTLYPDTAPTSETRVNFLVIN